MARQHPVAIIISSVDQATHLQRCLFSLGRQSYEDFEVLIVDDGVPDVSASAIGAASEPFGDRLRYVPAQNGNNGVLNDAIETSSAEYLVFLAGNCVVHPDFVAEHVNAAEYGYFVMGTTIRFEEELNDLVTEDTIASGNLFDAHWLAEKTGLSKLKLMQLRLGQKFGGWLNHRAKGSLDWQCENASCFREDAVSIEGFHKDLEVEPRNKDFGSRLINDGLTPSSVRYTAHAIELR